MLTVAPSLTAAPCPRAAAVRGAQRGHPSTAACPPPARRRGVRCSAAAAPAASVPPTTAIEPNPVKGKTFDYIIVGGGAAGCVLASKLSADGSKRVLLLEAGPDRTDAFEVKVPAGITRLFRSPLDWGLYTDRQKPLGQREVNLARGRLLGGSSSTNAALYHRGTAADYDAWGVEGWAARDVLPWFVRAETNSRGPSKYHGAEGAMSVEDPRYENGLVPLFFEAARQAGYNSNADFNNWDREQDGYGTFQVAMRRGERGDTARMYLKDARGRPNLSVVTGAAATRIAFEGKRAVGVEFVLPEADARNRMDANLATGGEVILSSGAIHSPQLLMLSGVGAAEDLAEMDIPVVADLPGVGQNLQDHPACVATYDINDNIAVTDQIYDSQGAIRPSVVAQYLLFRRGPLTSTGCDRGLFTRSSPSAKQPDLQIRFVPARALHPDGVSAYSIFGRLKELGLAWPSGFSFQIIACRPHSRGRVSLRTPSPYDAPSIDAGFLSDKRDLETLKVGLRKSRELASTAAFKSLIKAEVYPGQEEDEKYIRRTLHSANAVVGTCRMGRNATDGSVVDAQLRVHGLSGLRVIDASVMPGIIGGQTGAPAVMIAERAAHMLTKGTL